MRKLTDLVIDNGDENEDPSDERIPVSETGTHGSGLTGTWMSMSGGITLIRRGDDIVAISQNGMLHESLVLFETGLEELLHIDGIMDSDGYELDEVDLFEHEGAAPMPKAAAVWLKRMPGAFYTESALYLQPVRVKPRARDDYDFASIAGDDFGHILYEVERFARDNIASQYQTKVWSFQ